MGNDVDYKDPVAKARGEIQELAPIAVDMLSELLHTNSRKVPQCRDKLKAAIAVLDRAGIVPGSALELTGKDGAPIEHSGLTYPQLKELILELKRKSE